MSKKPIRFGNVLLCDYVARGENNKFVLVNAYSGGILVQQFPATIPLGLYCEYIPDKLGKSDITFEIKVAGAKIVEAGISIDALELSPQVIAIAHFIAKFNEEGAITVSASADGYKDTIVLNKEVRSGPIPSLPATASPQPAARSRPDAPES